MVKKDRLLIIMDRELAEAKLDLQGMDDISVTWEQLAEQRGFIRGLKLAIRSIKTYL